MYEDHQESEDVPRRPVGMTLLGGLYLFFFLLTVSTYGSPLPFMGKVYLADMAHLLVFIDSMVMLYLFLGLMKRQRLTWYLLLGYNGFEVVNALINLMFISPRDLEKITGSPIDRHDLFINNGAVIIAIFLLTSYIYRQRAHFTNRSPYLF